MRSILTAVEEVMTQMRWHMTRQPHLHAPVSVVVEGSLQPVHFPCSRIVGTVFTAVCNWEMSVKHSSAVSKNCHCNRLTRIGIVPEKCVERDDSETIRDDLFGEVGSLLKDVAVRVWNECLPDTVHRKLG
jgi:hypothetical protein